MKPILLKGYLDLDKQIYVEKQKDHERGYEAIAPFYTHLDKNDKPCGILVNRGWVPRDLKNLGIEKGNANLYTVQGVLYRGDPVTRETKNNIPISH